MKKKLNYRRRRRGVYIPPPIKLLALLLAAAGVFAWVRHDRGPGAEQPAGSGTEPVQGEPSHDPLPEKITTPAGVACTLTRLGEDAVYTGNLILVNNWTPFHFPDGQAEALSCILDERTDSYYVRDSSVLLMPEALQALNDMMDAFKAQGSRKSVQIVAGHRTTEYQQHLFDQSAERNGLEHAKQFVAQPGGSEHHTGLVVDFSILHGDGSSEEYQGTGEYAWINGNCQDYGWVVRYDMAKVAMTGISNEPWHFRYVGVPHATAMVNENLCLEEYIDYLKQFTFDQEHLTVECAAGTYEIWYAAGTSIHVPDSGEYTVSGNNVDGLIVTYKVE